MKKRVLSILLAVLLVFGLLPTAAFAQDGGIPGVRLNGENFPDPDFLSFAATYDTNHGLYGEEEYLLTEDELAAMAAVTELDLSGKNYWSLVGIEYFPGLISLNCSGNRLTGLDLSRNTALESLNCSGNQITALDISANTALRSLNASFNAFTQFCGNASLTDLDLSGNPSLTALDLSGSLLLSSLNVNGTQLTHLDLSNTAVTAGNFSFSSPVPYALAGDSAAFTFRVSDLPVGFDWNKVSGLTADAVLTSESITVSGALLEEIQTNGSATVEYSYQCSDSISQVFSLNLYFDDIAIDGDHFEDMYFREYVAQFDTNQDQLLSRSEREAVTWIDVSAYPDLSGLQGIEHFSNVTTVNYSNTKLTALNLDRNPLAVNLIGEGCSYPITVHPEVRTIKLDTLPGNFKESSASGWQGGAASNGLLTVDPGAVKVTYSYSCGNGQVVSFTLNVEESESLEQGLAIDSANFPDATFLDHVQDTFDPNFDAVLTAEEIAEIKSIHVANMGITTLAGIEHFHNLNYLDCLGNELTSLDLDSNTLIEGLECSDNPLTELKIDQCSILVGLNCGGTELTSLVLKNKNHLTDLGCSFGKLQTLDVSECPALEVLAPFGNELTELDVTGNPELIKLDASYMAIKELDLSNCVKMQKLDIIGTEITKLDVSMCPLLTYLDLTNSPITSIDLSNNPLLERRAERGWDVAFRDYSGSYLGFVTNRCFYPIDVEMTTYEVGGANYYAYDLSNLPNGFIADRASGWTVVDEYGKPSGGEPFASVFGVPFAQEGVLYIPEAVPEGYAIEYTYATGNLLEAQTATFCLYVDYKGNEIVLPTINNSEKAEFSDEDIADALTSGKDIVLKTGDTPNAVVGEGGLDQTIDANKNMTVETVDQLSDGQKIKTSFDVRALTAILEKANTGDVISFEVDVMTKDDLKEAQKDALFALGNDHKVVSAEVIANGQEVSDFKGGMASLLIPFTPGQNLTMSDYTVVYVSDIGEIEIVQTNTEDGLNMIAKVTHFSDYVVMSKADANLLQAQQGYTPVAINEVTFPDPVLRDAVKAADSNRNDQLDKNEMAAITDLTLSESGVSDLTGIGNLTVLRALDVSGNRLEHIDVSANAALEVLNVSGTPLESIDVSANTALVCLDVSGTPMNEVDVSANTALEILNVSGDPLQTLNVSANTALRELYASETGLTAIDVSENTALLCLDVSGNPLASLDLSANAALEVLNVSGTPLESIDVSANTALVELQATDIGLTAIDVSANAALEILNVSGNQLCELDVSQNSLLRELFADFNQLQEIDVTGNAALSSLGVYGNRLTDIDLSSSSRLEHLYIGQNPISALDLSQNAELLELDAGRAALTSLDVSFNPRLEILVCAENRLTSLDVSGNPALTVLMARGCRTDILIDIAERTFDLSTLPGFDVTKARGWTGGRVSGSILTVDQGASAVTYLYDDGNASFEDAMFTMHVTEQGTLPSIQPSVPVTYRSDNFATTVGAFLDVAYYAREARAGDVVTLKISLSEAGEKYGLDFTKIKVVYEVEGATQLGESYLYTGHPIYKDGVATDFKLGKGFNKMVAHITYHGVDAGSFAPFYANVTK